MKKIYNAGAVFGACVALLLLMKSVYHKAYDAGFLDGVEATMTILKRKHPTKQNHILIDTVHIDSFIGRWKV